MARKKNVEEAPVISQDVIKEEQLVVTSAPVDEETQPLTAPTPVDEGSQVAPVEQVNRDVVEPSEQIKKLLRCYFNYAALYVDSKGGVYPEGTQPNLVGDAILYQNPYYKS